MRIIFITCLVRSGLTKRKRETIRFELRKLNEKIRNEKLLKRFVGLKENRDKNTKLEHIVQTIISKLNPVPRR